MSELIQQYDNRATIRWKLLTGASVLALTVFVSSAHGARAEDADHTLVWIEAGGQVERSGNQAELLAPHFFNDTPEADLAPMVKAQNPAPYDFAMQGKLSLLPEGSDWVFSVSALYGRSHAQHHKHQQTPLPHVTQITANLVAPQPAYQQFGDGQSSLGESHFIVDFQAGKDVGIGLFGDGATSVVSAGVRFAQFAENASVSLNARPYNHLGDMHSKYLSFYQSQPEPHYVPIIFKAVDQFRRTYAASAQIHRNSLAIGPSISWDASVPFAGTENEATLNLDWGLNASVLFGRQRTTVHHNTKGHYISKTGAAWQARQIVRTGGYTNAPFARIESRSVTIPNAGAFAGMSLKFPNAKVSLGYRADVFFNAIDGGIDTRKEQNRAFYGPYASISIGVGD